MSKSNRNFPEKGILSLTLMILVAGSLYLAIIDQKNCPAYFDIAKIAVGYSFRAIQLQEKSHNSQTLDESKDEESEPENPQNPNKSVKK